MTRIIGKRAFVAGHRGMVGSAIVRRLRREECEILVAPRQQVDLRDGESVRQWFRENRPDLVFLAAAKVGGILANSTFPADFLYDNLLIATNVIDAARRSEAEKLLFLGSSCIYPKHARQPITESELLTGPLEPTNEAYAIAKIAGIKLAQAYRRQYGADFISAMPTNLYGPGDNYDPESSHVLAALIRKAHLLKTRSADALILWGTGSARREFLHVDDCADACVFLMEHYSGEEHVNVGTGRDITILKLARLVCELAGVEPLIEHDLSKPDGTPRKLLDISRILELGWQPRIPLRDGILATYADLLETHQLA